MIGIVMIVIFLSFMIIRTPICISMGLSTLIAMILSGSFGSLYTIPMHMIEGTQSYALLSIPFFIFTGNFMNQSGLTDRIFDFANVLVGHIRGGLAQVNVLSAMIFAGIQGTAVADEAGLGVIQIKAMTERGYNRALCAALTLASSIIGPLIPPSVGLVIIGAVTNTSIAKLFLGGVVPGILVGISLMGLNLVHSYTKPDFPKPERRATLGEVKSAFVKGFFALLAPVIIVGGMTGGFVTATEAGVLAAAYALITGFFYNKPKDVVRFLAPSLLDTAKTTALIMFLCSLGTSMTWYLALERVPIMITDSFLTITESKHVFLFLLNIFLGIVGMFIEGIPALLIILPILLPAVDKFGIDRVHFGMIAHLNLLIGMATPPVGVGLYVMTGVGKVKFEELVKAFMPFFIPLIIVLFMITFFPELTLFLPNLLLKD
jgi:tripartite ATP-independent transporter DctM subunit